MSSSPSGRGRGGAAAAAGASSGAAGAAQRRPAARRPRRAEEEEAHDAPRVIIHRPDDREELTDKQLAETVPRVLTANDPNIRTGTVCYSFAENAFKQLANSAESEHVAFHFVMDGSKVLKDSDEGVTQLASEKSVRDEIRSRRRALEARAQEEGKTVAELEEEIGDAGGRNQFNFSERAAQTYNAPMKDRGITTVPPETDTYGATVSSWDIYDAYVAEYERLTDSDGAEAVLARRLNKPTKKGGEATVHSEACGWALKILERMVTQNAQDELYSDFKYWEDESDKFKPGGMGTLLPLWRLTDARVRRRMVTAIAVNPRYPDLVAVAYGSYDFMRQGTGLICIYTLKNVGFPEFVFTLDSGAMCLAFHPTQTALLAVGCYDGTVRVYDVRKRENKPLYLSDIRSGKHTDPVWDVRWQADPLARDLTFLSVSSDGRVASWTLSKNELQMETLVSLRLVLGSGGTAAAAGEGVGEDAGAGGAAAAGGGASSMLGIGGAAAGAAVAEDDSALAGLAGGCCFDFNPFADHLFLVGTEEGRIHKCSKAYTGQYLETYDGHTMAVYSVRWNPFHERVFLSCSADWTIRLWDHLCPRAVAVFDLETAVGDIAWAPYSSTVFAAASANGKAYVFDLSMDKHDERCVQKIVKKAKLTHIAFSPSAPIVIVGDSHGGVSTLKLSPNLRRVTTIPVPEVKKGETPPPLPTRLEVEIAKLNTIMMSMDVRASIPIDTVTGKVAKDPAAANPAAAAAAAATAGIDED